MKEKNKKEVLDDKQWIKSMMESARKEPSENLSYRIMHEIETEQALTRARPKLSKQPVASPLKDLWIFGLMYFALLLVGGYFYLQGGREALLTDTFLWTCTMISAVFSFYFLIITIDNSLRKKQKTNLLHRSDKKV